VDKVYPKPLFDFYEHGHKDLFTIDDICHIKTIAVGCKGVRLTFAKSQTFLYFVQKVV
jgi:hypothetical protein